MGLMSDAHTNINAHYWPNAKLTGSKKVSVRPVSFTISRPSEYRTRGPPIKHLAAEPQIKLLFSPGRHPGTRFSFQPSPSTDWQLSACLQRRSAGADCSNHRSGMWSPLRRRTRKRPDRCSVQDCLAIRNPWQSLYGSRRWHASKEPSGPRPARGVRLAQISSYLAATHSLTCVDGRDVFGCSSFPSRI